MKVHSNFSKDDKLMNSHFFPCPTSQRRHFVWKTANMLQFTSALFLVVCSQFSTDQHRDIRANPTMKTHKRHWKFCVFAIVNSRVRTLGRLPHLSVSTSIVKKSLDVIFTFSHNFLFYVFQQREKFEKKIVQYFSSRDDLFSHFSF